MEDFTEEKMDLNGDGDPFIKWGDHGGEYAVWSPDEDYPARYQDGKRLKECWNAFNGIKNPADWIQAAADLKARTGYASKERVDEARKRMENAEHGL